jgi:hypothetical protein
MPLHQERGLCYRSRFGLEAAALGWVMCSFEGDLRFSTIVLELDALHRQRYKEAGIGHGK